MSNVQHKPQTIASGRGEMALYQVKRKSKDCDLEVHSKRCLWVSLTLDIRPSNGSQPLAKPIVLQLNTVHMH